jgi:nucleotide-binding universal stress UspA family protein
LPEPGSIRRVTGSTNLPAVKSIVVGITGSDTSKVAAREAVKLAAAFGASVHFVTVVREDVRSVLTVASDEWELSTLDQARSSVEHFITAEGVSVDFTVSAMEGDPAKALIEEAERLKADLIVVGNVRMQGIGRVLGSVGNDVAHHAPCNVLIVKTV